MSPPERTWPPPQAKETATTCSKPLHNRCDDERNAPWSPDPAHADRPVDWRTGLAPGSLFDLPAARSSDPPTSKAAAAGKGPYRSQLRAAVLAVHQAAPDGLTDDELAERLPDAHAPSVAKRRTDLARAGVLANSGRRRKTRRGSDAVVWVLTEDGIG